jgi:hypothetical protein
VLERERRARESRTPELFDAHDQEDDD